MGRLIFKSNRPIFAKSTAVAVRQHRVFRAVRIIDARQLPYLHHFTYSRLVFSNPRVGFSRFDTKLELGTANSESSTVELSIEVELLSQ